MNTKRVPSACTWRRLLAPLLPLLASLPSQAQQAPRQPTRPAPSSHAGLVNLTMSGVSSPQAQLYNATVTTPPPFRKDSLFLNPSFEGTPSPHLGVYGIPNWVTDSYGFDVMPATTTTGFGSTLTPTDGNAYIGLRSIDGNSLSIMQPLRTPLKAGVTYTFLVDVAYGINYASAFSYSYAEVPLTLRVFGSQTTPAGAPRSLLWNKSIPVTRASWQTDTVTFTPTTDFIYLGFQAVGSTARPRTRGAVLIDNLRTLPSLILQQANGTAQAANKAFRLLWQPVLSVGGLDSLARPQLKGTVRTFQGGRVPLPTSLQVTDSKGFYFYQEAAPAAGQDTLYYGLYVRNTPLANGRTDDTLRHLHECRRTFGSQAGLLGGALQPLTLGSLTTAQRVAPAAGASLLLAPRPAVANRAGQRPPAPRQPTPRLARPQPAVPASRLR